MKKILKKFKFFYDQITLKELVIKVIFYPFYKIRNKFLERKIFKKKNNKDIFTEINNVNYWNDQKSKSGSGSSLKSTENIRLKIPTIIKEFNIKSIIDVPCGDFFWFSKIIDELDIEYLGGDIVENIIIGNKKFENKKVKFKQFDIINDVIPNYDLLICRDCLFHFSYDDIKRTFENFKNSQFQNILITNHDLEKTDIENEEIKTGSFRYLDFHLPPFNFKKNYNQQILDLNYPRDRADKVMLIYSREKFISNIEDFLR